MSLRDKLEQSIQRFSAVFSRQAESVRSARQQIDAVFRPLSELMTGFSQEFPDFKLVKNPDKLSLSFTFDSKSTLVKSVLRFDAESQQFTRHDDLDLNLPDLIFELAGSKREGSAEVHDFVYASAQDAIDADVQWIGWAVALLRHERANPDL
jgi:hypothetical protein